MKAVCLLVTRKLPNSLLTKTNGKVYNGVRYSVDKTPYVQWKFDALAWANSKRTNIGDLNIGYDEKYAYIYEAYDPGGDGRATDYRVLEKISMSNKKLLNYYEGAVEGNNERIYRESQEIRRLADSIENDESFNESSRAFTSRELSNVRNGKIFEAESYGNGTRSAKEGSGNK